MKTKKTPMELFIWRNQKHLRFKISHSVYAGGYGTRYTKWNYDFVNDEFTFKKWKQIDKHEWSKEPTFCRVSASALLYDEDYPNSKIWVEFLEAQKEGR